MTLHLIFMFVSAFICLVLPALIAAYNDNKAQREP